jgi:uncharacterized protein (DUF2147 family)
MARLFSFRLILLLTLAFVSGTSVFAQADPIEGFWYNDEKTAKVQIYKAKDTKFYGKIAWLKEPNENGKPKVDGKNPDKAKRTQPIMGLMLLKGFEKDEDNVYTDGKIYDPKNGKTYDCKLTLKGNALDIRGYVGMPAFGRTTTFTRAD